jgi:hypothetical protein
MGHFPGPPAQLFLQPPPIVLAEGPLVEPVPDTVQSQLIPELSPCEGVLVFLDMAGELRWTRVALSRVIGSTYGCLVHQHVDGESAE